MCQLSFNYQQFRVKFIMEDVHGGSCCVYCTDALQKVSHQFVSKLNFPCDQALSFSCIISESIYLYLP